MILFASAVLAAAQYNTTIIKLTVDGFEREATVVAPVTATSRQAPLVFAWHGHGGNMRFSARQYDIQGRWTEAIGVYPQGLPTKGLTDPTGSKPGWQQKAGDDGDRDLHFFDALYRKLDSIYKVDHRRVYSVGHSNGGRFTYLLWAKRPSYFAAYGISASPAVAEALVPASVCLVAGEKDPIVPFRIQKWSMNRVQGIIGANGNQSVSRGYFSSETSSAGYEFATYIHPGSHTFPKEAGDEVFALFKRHPRL